MSFIKGNLITMADGSKKKIEDLAVGDIVKDGYGINVFVRGLTNLFNVEPWKTDYDQPSQKPIKINGEIVCIKDQIFMGADGYFYVLEGVNNNLLYPPKILHFYFIADKNKFLSANNFDIRNRIKTLQIGSVIMKETGPVEVNTIEILEPISFNPPEKDVWKDFYYNNNNDLNVSLSSFLDSGDSILKHKIGGRGTYIVDGYICLATQNPTWDYEKNIYDPSVNYGFVKGNDGIIQRFIK